MLVTNKPFVQKPLLVVSAVIIIALAVVAGGIGLFGLMIEVGQSELSARSQNGMVP